MLMPDSRSRAHKELWEREYRDLQVIPSSTRTLPSKALVASVGLLKPRPGQRVLDVGCGNGRNSVYLAQRGCEVHSVDFSHAALSRLHLLAARASVDRRIHAYDASAFQPLPFRDSAFSLVVDSYLFCHFQEDGAKHLYLNEVYRVLRPGGVLFVSLFSPEDEYYRPMIGKDQSESTVIVDPHNGIAKQLYTKAEIAGVFRRAFRLRNLLEFEFDDIVLGGQTHRRVLILVMSK